MEVKRFVVGEIQTNCYAVIEKDELFFIDPGGFVRDMDFGCKGIKCRYILLTHNHYDHIAGVEKLKSLYPEAEIAVHENDLSGLNDPEYNGASLFGVNFNPIKPALILKGGEKLTFGRFGIKVFHTPGHTEGSVSFLVENCLFTGDTLFRRGVGRCDLPSGDWGKLTRSLKSYYDMGKNYKVFPGHGDYTDLESERNFVLSLDSF
ncbi:MBL fold metallo-hydrolase [candidate division WOR-3 bacterium]|nr:MBL fold metallo-hydrolase [candidate division WOR-3 bacterium]